MKILITGGAGFVGSYLTEELLSNDKPEIQKIVILDNLVRGSYENMNTFINDKRIEFVKGDIRDEMLVNKLIKEVDYIFHLAALRINACAADPKEGFDVMAKSTFNIIDSAARYGIKKFIYSSSASIYGLAQNFPTSETDNPYDNQTFYGACKIFGEQLLRSYKYMFGLDYVALRYFNIYGPRMDTDGKYTEVMIKWLDCIRDKRNPAIYGDGRTSMDFVYVQDVAKANVLALKKDVTDEVFNIGTQRETSLNELLHMLIQINNVTLKVEYKEEKVANPVSRRIANNNKAKELLGFKPAVKLEEGLKHLTDWYFSKLKSK